MAIFFYREDTKFDLKPKMKFKRWIRGVVGEEKSKTGDLTFVFCSDNYLLQINNQYLSHDYFTDVITFDYTEEDRVSGDIFISIDRVKDNAKNLKIPFQEELHRVIIHGVLHLLGYKDKTTDEIKVMRRKENYYIAKLSDFEKK